MNPTAAENFINSLVRNLQVLCHSNVEFRNDIEVVGHLYLKVDKTKKISYIVDETVLKNDSSSTVFVSNSYHSVNTSKKKQNENQEENTTEASPPPQQSSNTGSRSDLKRQAENLSDEAHKTKSRKRSGSDYTPKKSSSQSSTPNRHHSNTGNFTNIKTESLDLSLIKREPLPDDDDNLPCFFASQNSSPKREENLRDTGQSLESQNMHQYSSSQSLMLPPHTSSSASSSHSNILSSYHSTSVNNDLLEEMKGSLSQPVFDLLMASNSNPPPTIQELSARYCLDEDTVRCYLKNKKEMLDCFLKSQRFLGSMNPSKRMTLEDKVKLIQMAELDSPNRPSQSMLAKHFGISQPTTCRILSQKDKILEEYQQTQLKRLRQNTSESDEIVLL